MAPDSNGDTDTGTVSASDRSPPENVQQELDRRRKAWLDQTKREAEIDAALRYTDEERKEINTALREIADELNILGELEDLRETLNAPHERYVELLEKKSSDKKEEK